VYVLIVILSGDLVLQGNFVLERDFGVVRLFEVDHETLLLFLAVTKEQDQKDGTTNEYNTTDHDTGDEASTCLRICNDD
jgi:hypothetical protein